MDSCTNDELDDIYFMHDQANGNGSFTKIFKNIVFETPANSDIDLVARIPQMLLQYKGCLASTKISHLIQNRQQTCFNANEGEFQHFLG
ncbi:hypothetical protein CEXT_563581 [Caerostris extrusa]|uniref:Uncharacterized protein n=1 Tax=Caerostris extrusa TaxID=172846 RepID=A0AAV4XIX1_CAEEX|nr:hypothetical protein CEXT_563581 [Caerostris extrusa]